MYALIDCNNFYASCERVFRPLLNGRPVVVLSNNDGCVIARSNEAKKLGVPMGAPAFEYEPLFKEHGIAVFSSNYELYGDMSRRVMDMLAGYCPDVEIYSIDEAFLKYTGFEHLINYKKQGLVIREEVTRGTGIPISIGFAQTKALAKVANKIAKKFPGQTGGVHVIDSEELRIKALKWTEIGDVWGIGRQYAKKLQALGVKTAYDFAAMPEQWAKDHMTVVGQRLWKELNGISCLELDEVKDKKNIACTRSFNGMITEYEPLAERVKTFAVTVGEKLRRQGSECNSIMVFVHTNPFRQDLPRYDRNIVIKLPFPTNSNIELARFADQALQQIYKKGYHYKKAGVIAMGFTPVTSKQLSLFGQSDPRHIALMGAVDQINKRSGTNRVRLAGQSAQRNKMKQERLSPCYTTRIEDLLRIKV